MFNKLRDLLSLFSTRERKHLMWLLAAVIIMGILQASSVASIMPFLAVVAKPDLIQTNQLLNALYSWIGGGGTNHFLFVLGVIVLLVLLISNTISALTTWALLRFSQFTGFRLSRRLLASYLSRSYPYFLGRNSTELTKNILSEADRVTQGVLVPALQVVARIVTAGCIIAILVIVDPAIAFTVALVMGAAYAFVFVLSKKKLRRIGRMATEAGRRRFRITSEAFGVIKYAKLLGIEQQFVDRYAEPSRLLAQCNSTSRAISQLPKYALEVIAFGGIMVILLFLIKEGNAVGALLPLLGLYAFAGYRLLPQMQQIFNQAAQIRFSVPALEILIADLRQQPQDGENAVSRDEQPVALRRQMVLENVRFAYPGADRATLVDLTLKVDAGTVVGLVGSTGAGKTTTLDIVLGLLRPDSGRLCADGVVISSHNVSSWQRNLGYVPQHIYLADDTIRNNIAFGVRPEDVDQSIVERAAKMAQLYDFVNRELPDGFETQVGERGVRLSGGEQQRIGIARALYRLPKVLILDEATSALDTLTEKAVLDAIAGLPQEITVIMVTHRLTTLSVCDMIHVLDEGRIITSGTYHELLATSPQFSGMTKAAAAT